MRLLFGRNALSDPEPLIRRVYAYVAYRVGDGPDAEDLTSETFERALRYSGTYDPSRGEPAAWLIGIARRVIADAAERPAPAALGPDSAPPDVAADGDLEGDTVRRLSVAALVRTLEEHDRELISLRYGADLTAAQIGSLLGMRTNAVEVALHRALGRLRALLGEDAAVTLRAKSR
jgi:RNA polymerase sigma factor (sigma-70 family)